MGANKPIEGIEATLLAATKSALDEFGTERDYWAPFPSKISWIASPDDFPG
jgi:hypothetical protein